MTDICTTIKDILLTAAIANFPGDTAVSPTTSWNIELHKMPDTPEQVIAIMSSGGKTPNPKWAVDYPSVQVLVRGKASDTDSTRTKMQQVKDALLGHDSATINGDRVVAVNMIGDIVSAGFDTSNRPMFSVNFSLIVEPASTGNRASL